MSRYVLVEVGCRECSQGTSVLLVTDDLDAIKAAWDEWQARDSRPLAWGARGDQDPYEDGWPANVISVDVGSSYALVAYDMTLDPNHPEDPA